MQRMCAERSDMQGMETPATLPKGVIIEHCKNLLGGFLLWGRAFFVCGKEADEKKRRLFLSMLTAWLRCHGVLSVIGGNSVFGTSTIAM